MGLTQQQKHDARMILEGNVEGRTACLHCGGIHLRACRRVRRAEWHVDGTLLRVWYWPDGKWSDEETVWPEQAYADDDEEDIDQEEKA